MCQRQHQSPGLRDKDLMPHGSTNISFRLGAGPLVPQVLQCNMEGPGRYCRAHSCIMLQRKFKKLTSFQEDLQADSPSVETRERDCYSSFSQILRKSALCPEGDTISVSCCTCFMIFRKKDSLKDSLMRSTCSQLMQHVSISKDAWRIFF